MMSNDVVNIISYSTTYCLHMFELLFHDEYDSFYTVGYLTCYCLLTYYTKVSYSYCQLGPLGGFFGNRPRESYGEKVVRS